MPKILVVDDDENLAFAISQRLRADHFQCFIAHDGEQGFAAAKQELPDLIILDLMMPGMTGYELCRRIRRDPQIYATSILMLSGLGDEPEIVHGLEEGADDYISKPFRVDNLLKKVEALVSKKNILEKLHPELGLPCTESLKRQIDHRLARDERVAVCYFDILYAAVFRKVYGTDAFGNAIKLAANTLKNLRDGMKMNDIYLGYMGGQHFAAVTNPEQFKPYCNTVASTFKQRVVALYRPIERQQGYIVYTDQHGREAKDNLMCFGISVVHNRYRKFQCARQMFDVLTGIKAKAENSATGGIFVDRRCEMKQT